MLLWGVFCRIATPLQPPLSEGNVATVFCIEYVLFLCVCIIITCLHLCIPLTYLCIDGMHVYMDVCMYVCQAQTHIRLSSASTKLQHSCHPQEDQARSSEIVFELLSSLSNGVDLEVSNGRYEYKHKNTQREGAVVPAWS